MDLPGPSLSSTESSCVSDSYGTYDDVDYDDAEQSELTYRPTKKARFTGAYKYKLKFSKEWTKTWSFVAPVPHCPSSFRCTVCCKTLSCAHQGIADVRNHVAGKNHQRLARGMEAQTQLSFTPDPLSDKVRCQSRFKIGYFYFS